MVLNCAGETRKRDVTTMFTYSHANTPLGQSERAYYLSYFINLCERALSGNERLLQVASREYLFNVEHFCYKILSTQVRIQRIETLSTRTGDGDEDGTSA